MEALYEQSLSDDKDTWIKACDQLSQKVSTKELKVNDLISQYKSFLSTASKGKQAMRSFAEIIARADATEPFGDDETRTLSRFLAARLEDKLYTTDISRALCVLCSRSCTAVFSGDDGTIDPEYAGAIAVGLVSCTSECGGSITSDSKYETLHTVRLSLKHANFDGQEAVALLAGVRPLFVGERNTRVLNEAFTIFSELLAISDPAVLTTIQQSVFDAFASYFPVLFVPYDSTVSKEDLVIALRRCFAASKALLPLSLPFLIDKTASSIASARADAFRTLESCIKSFGPDAFPSDFVKNVSESLQQNGFLAAVDAAVNDIVLFVTTLYSTFLSSRKHCEEAGTFMHEFLSFCYAALYPPKVPTEDDPAFDEEVSSCARKYIARIARYPECSHLLPTICKKLSDKALAEETPAVYRYIPIGTAADVASSAAVLISSKAVTARLVREVAESVAETLAAVLALPPPHGVEDVCEAAKGVGPLAALVKTVPETLQGVEGLIKALASLAVSSAASDVVRSHCIEDGLREAGLYLPESVVSYALDALVKSGSAVALVPALASCNDILFRGVVDKLTTAIVDPAVFAAVGDGETVRYRATLFAALRKSLKEACRFAEPDAAASSSTALAVAKRLVDALAQNALLKTADDEKLFYTLICSIRTIVSYVVELLSDSDQQLFVRECVAKSVLLLGGGNNGSALSPECPELYSLLFSALSSLSPPNATALFAEMVPVLLAYIAATPSSEIVTGPADTAAALYARDNINSCCLALAALLNKYQGSDTNSADSLFGKAVSEVISRKDPLPLAWVTRALVMRSHPRGTDALGIILTLCAFNEDTSDYFYIVTSKECPVDEGLVVKSGAVLRDNYNEKIFNDSLERLLSLHKAAPERKAPAFAIAMVMSSGPKELVAEKAERCIPVVVRALNFVGPETQSTTILGMVNTLIATVPRNFKDFVPQIIGKMCAIATTGKFAKVRALALTVLLTIRTKVSESVALLYQDLVIKKLKPALDDPKRPVRTLAVTCVNAWYVF